MDKKISNYAFTILLLLGFFLSIFRGFDITSGKELFTSADRTLDSSRIKPVIQLLHRKDNLNTGVIKEKLSYYQHLKVLDADRKKDVVVVEASFENSAKSAITYNILDSKLILENGERISVSESLTAPFDDEFGVGYTQIGNLVFETASENLKAIEFPDGSICGL